MLSDIKASFNGLPSAVKVIIYSGISVFLATLVEDLTLLDTVVSKYLVVALAIPINLVAYLLLNEKD